jgi:hypothetical protein
MGAKLISTIKILPASSNRKSTKGYTANDAHTYYVHPNIPNYGGIWLGAPKPHNPDNKIKQTTGYLAPSTEDLLQIN